MHAEVRKWIAAGEPNAYDYTGVPHEVKQHVLLTLLDRYELDVFVETGTCHGAMTEVIAPHVSEVYTIEMLAKFHTVARERLSKLKHVNCLLGDSAVELERVVSTLDKPALFFLDAHYSGPGTARGEIDTPVARELELLRWMESGSVIVIDDARLFEGEEYHTAEFKDYPSREWIEGYVRENYNGYAVDHWGDAFIVRPND